MNGGVQSTEDRRKQMTQCLARQIGISSQNSGGCTSRGEEREKDKGNSEKYSHQAQTLKSSVSAETNYMHRLEICFDFHF